MSTPIQQLDEFGQSAWLDNISRDHINSGKLKKMIDQGILGETSNPTIFNNAINKSADYDETILRLVNEERSSFEIYDELTIKDVQDAADIFNEVHELTNGKDGYISLEVSPKLAHKTEETINEARRLWKRVNKLNLMIKVPSTKEGIPAIKRLTSEGINVNATLIFSIRQYKDVANAYVRGLEEFVSRGGSPKKISSVASVFVSRIDSFVDKMLDEVLAKNKSKRAQCRVLKGKAAVTNSKSIYQEYLKIFSSSKFKALGIKGAKTQRVLWASTGTKNPDYSDVKYVSELIGKNTVNTMPDKTYEAFLDHGEVKEAVTIGVNEAKKVLHDLKGIGVDINKVCDKLLKDGVIAFERSFDELLSAIEQKRMQLAKI